MSMKTLSERRQRERRYSEASVPPLFLAVTLSLLLGVLLLPGTHSFGGVRLSSFPRSSSMSPSKVARKNLDEFPNTARKARPSGDEEEDSFKPATETRRGMLARAASSGVLLAAASAVLPTSSSAAAPQEGVNEMVALIKEANGQLEKVSPLIQAEKWDGVRQVLMEAPLRDCWSKSTPILKKYADALGETPKGDELAALEGREDLLQHLRFLDMAVYNNVFNPIATEGKTGASKALIDSYYNDPTREYEASKKAIEGLIQLSNDAQ